MLRGLVLLLITLTAVSAQYGNLAGEDFSAPVYSYKVVKEYPHRAQAWTEGLSFVNGELYESTGPTPYNMYSSPKLGGGLAKINLSSGIVEDNIAFKDIYGEGAAHIGGVWFVLSYEESTSP